jgi:hypothetical protein
MVVRIRVTIKLSRYQKEKEWGEMYRAESNGGESFTEFKKRKKIELRNVEMINNTEQK